MAASVLCCCPDLKNDKRENGVPCVIFEIPLVAIDKYLESERLPRNVGMISDAHDPTEILRCPNEFRSLWISLRTSRALSGKLATLGRLPNLTHWRFDALLNESDSDDLSTCFATHFRAHRQTLRSVEVVHPSYVHGIYANVHLPALEDLAQNLPVLENLDRLIFRVPELPETLYRNGVKFTHVRYLHLQTAPIANAPNLIIDAPNLEFLNFHEECRALIGSSSLDLTSSTRLKKVDIHSFRRIVLSESNPHLQHVIMTHVLLFEGHIGNLSVLELYSCRNVPEIVSQCGRNLRELHITGYAGRPDERHRRVCVDNVQVLKLRNIAGILLTSSACLEVLYIHDVEFVEQQPSFSAKRLHLMSSNRAVADMKAHVDLGAVTHLAIQAHAEPVFSWDSMMEEQLKDTLVLFATDIPLRSDLPPLRNVQFLGLSRAQDFKFLLPSIHCTNRIPLKEIAIFSFDPALGCTTMKMLQEVFCEDLSLPSPAPINWVEQFFNSNIGVRSNLIGPGKIDRVH